MSDGIPPQHEDVIESVRTLAANAPDSLREHLTRCLDDYLAQRLWVTDPDG